MGDVKVTADDMPPLPACGCIDMGNGIYVSNGCRLRRSVLGILRERPVVFTGLLSILNAVPGGSRGGGA